MNTPAQIPLFGVQRWRERRASYRPVGEPIDPRRYGVEVVVEREARAFVEGHHYSGSFPAARLSVGLHRAGAGLVGVAVFSVGVQPKAITRWCGLPHTEGIELGRFVLLDEEPANAETWFLRRAFEVMRAELPEVRAVLAYSDPMKRASVDGSLVLPGHVGTIYQAHNGRYVGRAEGRTLNLDANGRVVSGRALTKIRKGERGAGPAVDGLVAAGARRPRQGEDLRAWLDDVLVGPAFRRVKHPGNHTYVWPVDGQRSTLRALAPVAGAYPKHTEAP